MSAFFTVDVISNWRFFLFKVLSISVFLHPMFFQSTFFTFRRFVPVDIFLHSTFFPVNVFYSSTFCPSPPLLSLTFCPSGRLFHLTFCPSTFFTVGVFYFDVLSVNQFRSCWALELWTSSDVILWAKDVTCWATSFILWTMSNGHDLMSNRHHLLSYGGLLPGYRVTCELQTSLFCSLRHHFLS
jgi:hypothetical protein